MTYLERAILALLALSQARDIAHTILEIAEPFLALWRLLVASVLMT